MTGSAKKSKKPTTVDLKEFYQSTLDAVHELEDETTEDLLSGPFNRLPPKKLYPDYYEIIDDPISLAEILKSAKVAKYTSPDSFLQDFQLLLDNAARYNDPESWIVSSATKIYDYVKDQIDQLDSPPKSDSKSLKLKLKAAAEPDADHDANSRLPELASELLETIISHDFPDEGIISAPFIEDVDLEEYPDYINYVESPTSFQNVLSQIEDGLFSHASVLDNLQTFYDATALIFSNAQQYNDPSSEIHQDALKLQELFDEKYNELKEELTQKRGSKLKLKLKPKVKLNLKVKSDKSRKRKDVKDEPEEEIVEEEPISEVPEEKHEVDAHKKAAKPVEKSSANTLGKSAPTLSAQECFIQESSLSSSLAVVSSITKHTNQKASHQQHLPLPRNQEIKKALFPTLALSPVTSFFEYRIPSNGYASQSYTVSLPADLLPYVTLKVSLHSILHDIKRHDLVNGRGYLNLTSDEDFQCKLSVNDEEVTNGGDCNEEKKNGEDLLGISFDVKLTLGLNVVNFECKVAPSLSKKIKPTENVESDEIAGRHTRHQLQQLKMTWDVERVTFFVVCNHS